MKKKLSCILLAILFVLSFSGCRKGYTLFEETSLETAYANGFLTQEDLKSIAYYYNRETQEPDFELIPKIELSQYIEDSIKMSYLQKRNLTVTFPNATVNDIKWYVYYGTYNGYAVVEILDSLRIYDLRYEKEKIIGGVTFYDYNYLIKVYDIESEK